jgi:uncharacterized protein (TIGR02117 family)
MRSFIQFFYRLLKIVCATIIIYLCCALICSSITINNTKDSANHIAIYILSNGVHTDIVVPTQTEIIDWSTKIKFQYTKTANENYHYLALGWGDKGFYLETPTWGDLKLSTALKAATGLSHSAMHATYYRSMQEGEKCKKIILSTQQYLKLITYIDLSFQKHHQEYIPIVTHANYGNTDAFYEANYKYSLLHTCNTWTNNALKACDQKCALWTPFEKGIISKYQ